MEFTEQEKKVLADKYETFKEEIELAMIQNCILFWRKLSGEQRVGRKFL